MFLELPLLVVPKPEVAVVFLGGFYKALPEGCVRVGTLRINSSQDPPA